MKNVLFIGPYNSPSGWGEASRRYIKQLAKCNINLCVSPIYMSNGYQPTEFAEYEQNRSSSYDIIIQNVLPHLATRFHDSKNILLADFETNHIEHTGWLEPINLMDEVWVDTAKEVQILKDSGCTKTVTQTVMPVDIDEYNIPLDDSRLNDLKGRFVFYFIGEFTERKNLKALLMAYHREFHYTENVLLVIKTSLGNNNPNHITDLAINELGSLKSNFRLYPNQCDHLYKSELLITERFSQNELYAMHKLGNCFIMPSRGESSCLPILDAMYFNSHCIATKNTGMETTVGSNNKYLVKSTEVPVYCEKPPLSNIYTLRETWQEINVLDLQKKMRAAQQSLPASRGDEYIAENHGLDSLVPLYNKLLGV